MISFLSNKQASEKIADLEQRVGVLQTENDAAQVQIAELQTDNGNLSEQVSTLTESVSTLTSQAEALTGERDQANEALSVATIQLEGFDERVEAASLAKFQSLGGTPAPAANSDSGSETMEKTRDEFNAMTPAARVEYSKAGRKLKV